jgi:DegV family protein with EDD domain
MKIAVVTDSNSGLSQEMGKKLGVTVIPMPFFIDGNEYFEGINLSQKEFFDKLANGSSFSTSQPAIGVLMETWDEVLKDNDYLLYFPMSSGLSKSCETATILSKSDEYEGKVFVIDNKRISVPLLQSIYDALELIKKGLDVNEIVKILLDTSMEHDIFIMLDTLEYLKKGGRITPAAAMLGGFLKLKPVLLIKGDKLDSYKMRNRTLDGAKQILKDACRKCMDKYLEADPNATFHFEVAYSGVSNEEALKLAEEIKLEFNTSIVTVMPLSLSISCHTGPGALGMAISKVVRYKNEEVLFNNKISTLKEAQIN